MTFLDVFAGSWAGTNGFRLMPSDPLAEHPATLTVTPGAGGHLTSVAYTWRHPDDGDQEGMLALGEQEDGSLVALWADSWHQKPAPMTLSGKVLEAQYEGGFAWRIVFEPTGPDELTMRMDNVVPPEYGTPEAPAGPYPAMLMNLHRA
ncbi:hypothetical protein [Actinomadura roseirufa]|uniref:hypothetical protein n=1 Tax=Actinomadura roseirufa TaxID=2094049 RepID=UPI00104185F4|nr:hypothetical protein [Actinomadura roseirufa]